MKSLLPGWIYSVLKILSGFLLLPLVLTKFGVEEINVWFLYFSVIGISEMVVFGFNSTFVRFISYTIAGVHFSKFNEIKNNSISTENLNKDEQLSDIYSLNLIIFGGISIIYFFVLNIGGFIALSKPISYLSNPSAGWFAWYFLISGSTIRILTYTFPVFIQGNNKMSLYYNILTIEKTLYLLLGILLMIFIPSLVGLSLVAGGTIIIASIIHYISFKRINENNVKFNGFNKSLFLVIWDSAWKSGITKILAPIIQNIGGIIFAQFASPVSSSSYLFTERIFKLLQQFSDTVTNTIIPEIAFLKATAELRKLKINILKYSRVVFGVIGLGYLVIILFGNDLLLLIKGNTILAEKKVLVLFSFVYMISRLSSFQLTLSNIANNVIEHKAIFIYSIIYFPFLSMIFIYTEMWVFPLAMLLALTGSFLYVQKYSYKLYSTSFFKAEKLSFIPIFILLCIINAAYLYI